MSICYDNQVDVKLGFLYCMFQILMLNIAWSQVQFHVTARLKAHNTQRLLNSFVSLDSRTVQSDKEGPKKATGLPPVHRTIHKSMSDASHLNHSFKNGYETKLSNKQVSLRGLAKALKSNACYILYTYYLADICDDYKVSI